MKKASIAIFASGTGTNAENIIEYFQSREKIGVGLVISNKADSEVLKRAKKQGVPGLTITNEELQDPQKTLRTLNHYDIDFIVLAGFLKLIPDYLVKAYPQKIINIHPALLPKYGGKGMFGSKVHKAVIANNEKKTGITIHYVNESYDDGAIIFQEAVTIDPESERIDQIEAKVHHLEYIHYPRIIDAVVTNEVLGN